MTLTIDIPRDERAPAAARDAVRGMDDAIGAGIVPDVMLLISELVTNSVKYGGEGVVRLEIDAAAPEHVSVRVGDGGTGFVPVARSRPKSEVGGWGLHLVDELTDRWGVLEGANHVWFEMSRRGTAAIL